MKEEIYKSIIRFLQFRMRTEAEVREKLESKGFGEEDIEATLGELKEQSWIDDEVFAKKWAQERIESRHYGERRILSELKVKGIAESTAKRILNEMQSEYDPTDQALEYLNRKYRKNSGSEDEKKSIDALIRSGYTYSTACKAVKLFFQRTKGSV